MADDKKSQKNANAPAVRIVSKREGFRCAGIAHTEKPVTHPAGTFTAQQIEQLKACPMLVVEVDA